MPSKLSNYKVSCKNLNFKFGTKNSLFGCFGHQFWKTIVIFEICAFNFAYCKIGAKINILKFGTKNARFSYFEAGISKYYCHIWNQRPRICLVAKFGAKIKILKSGSKNVWFGYFWTGSWKLYCHIWNQHPQCKNENA